MNTKHFKIFVVTVLTLLVYSSCSKCYECETETTYNGVVDTTSTDICTADPKEIESLENEGYTCNAQ